MRRARQAAARVTVGTHSPRALGERVGRQGRRSYFDSGSMAIIALTLVLFVIALLVNGFTHDLLQKCGLFLVSADHDKPQERRFGETGEERLAEIQTLLQTKSEQSA